MLAGGYLIRIACVPVHAYQQLIESILHIQLKRTNTNWAIHLLFGVEIPNDVHRRSKDVAMTLHVLMDVVSTSGEEI